MKKPTLTRMGLATLLVAGSSSLASAAIVGPIAGNECGAGGFSSCELTIDGNVTPAIIKFDSNFAVEDISTAFPSVTGEEFDFFNVVTDQGEVEGASFTYTLGAGDPGITGFAVFGAGEYLLYESDQFTFNAGVYSGQFSTLGLGDNPNNPTPGLSHITFFDTAVTPPPAPIPLPAGALLLLTGLVGFGAIRKRA